MSFLGSEKDLRQLSTKKTTKPLRGGVKTTAASKQLSEVTQSQSQSIQSSLHRDKLEEDDIITRTRREREARQQQRLIESAILKIQCDWRGYNSRKVLMNELLSEVSKKVDDMKRLNEIMLKQKGCNLSLGADAIYNLLRKLIWLLRSFVDNKKRSRRWKGAIHWNSKLLQLLVNFSEVFVIPSLSQVDLNKNILQVFLSKDRHVSLISLKFIEILIVELEKFTQSERLNDLILPQMASCAKCLSAMITTTNTNVSREFMSVLCHRFHIFERLKSVSNDFLFKYFLLSKETSLSEKITQSSGICDSLMLSLLKLSEYYVESSRSFSSTSTSMLHTYFDVMCLPYVTMVTSKETMETFLLSSPFMEIIRQMKENCEIHSTATNIDQFLNEEKTLLSHLSSVTLTRGYFFLGNLICLLRLGMGKYIESQQIASLTDHLSVCVSLMDRYPIYDLLRGRNVTLWSQDRNSSVLTASTIPFTLQLQIVDMGFLDINFLKALIQYSFTPVYRQQKENETVRGYCSDAVKERNAIATVLGKHSNTAHSGVAIAQESLRLDDSSFGSLFSTSKWAKKLFSKTTKSVATSPAVSHNPHDIEEYLTHTAVVNGIHESLCSVLIELLSILCIFASNSSTGSIAWKTVSSLSFYPTIFPLLWQSMKYFSESKYKRIDTTAADKSSKWSLSSIFKSSSSKLTTVSSTIGLTNVEEVCHTIEVKDTFHGMKGKEIIFNYLCCLTALLKMSLVALDDDELYILNKPVPLFEFLPFIRGMKVILIKFIRYQSDVGLTAAATEEKDTTGFLSYFVGVATGVTNTKPSTSLQQSYDSVFSVCLINSFSAVLSDMHSRWSRKPFTDSMSLWEMPSKYQLSSAELNNYGDSPSTAIVFRHVPWTVPFSTRLQLLRRILNAERQSIQQMDPYDTTNRSRGTVVRIRRHSIVLDGMNAFNRLNGQSTVGGIKDRVVVRYIDDFGNEEMGIDLGGLFKDFLTEIVKTVFRPDYGIFVPTSNGLLYPNPNSSYVLGGSGSGNSNTASAAAVSALDDSLALFTFLGQLLGKAIYEDITIQPQFAHFFLSLMHGKYNFVHIFDDLVTLDEDLYKNLKFLKYYEGNIEDLDLTFSVSDNSFGVNREIDLIPGGSRVAVTSTNKLRYIDAAAKYYLYDRISNQAQAFFRGLDQVIHPDLLGLFSPPELQVLISGVTDEKVDMNDLKQNTRYAGGFMGVVDINIIRFWNIVEKELTEEQRRLLIKFVTSCERAPSLGFSSLQPPFTIQRIDNSDDSRLPSASTCFNTLKLPSYSSQKVMKEKLLYAIQSNSGFDLS